jgi:hypothetical protein
MRLASVVLARVLAYIETFDLNPRGKVYFPDIVQALVQRYGFQQFPQTFEQFDEQKGVEFQEGRLGDVFIQKLTIFSTLLVLDTRSNTNDSKRAIEEALVWASTKFGLTYKPGMIKRFAYVSDVSFYSDVPILSVNRALTNVAEKTSAALSDIWQEPVRYEPMSLMVGHDPMERKYGIAPFSIQRRAESRFSENKYFSEAPLPTDLHLQLLEQYEKEILATTT